MTNKYIKTNDIIDWTMAEHARREGDMGTPPPEIGLEGEREMCSSTETPYSKCRLLDEHLRHLFNEYNFDIDIQPCK